MISPLIPHRTLDLRLVFEFCNLAWHSNRRYYSQHFYYLPQPSSLPQPFQRFYLHWLSPGNELFPNELNFCSSTPATANQNSKGQTLADVFIFRFCYLDWLTSYPALRRSSREPSRSRSREPDTCACVCTCVSHMRMCSKRRSTCGTWLHAT